MKTQISFQSIGFVPHTCGFSAQVRSSSAVLRRLASALCKVAAAVIVAAPASWVLAQRPVLELEQSVDGMASWQHVTVTPGMIVSEGKLRMVELATGASTFFRMKITTPISPPPSIDMVLIPAGSFTMGRTSGDTDPDAPPVTVNVSAFYMEKYEVTKELWDEVRVWGASNGYTDLAVGNGSYASKGANHPVHSITWYDMVKWCNARSEKEGRTPCYIVSGATYKTGLNDAVVCDWVADGYRLPTEAEWEKAARGGVSGKRFPWGTDTINHTNTNYSAGGGYFDYDTGPYPVGTYHPTYNDGVYPYTSPVGSFAPNGYGLYDMAGSMWERCWDWYGNSTYVNGATNPRGPASGETRVYRGGGWNSFAYYCRAAYRSYDGSPAFPPVHLGFRVAHNSVP